LWVSSSLAFPQNAPALQTQQLAFTGLRSSGAEGQFNAVATDPAGDIYLLLDQKDGVRLLKTDNAASAVLAQALLGAKGDIGLALALDPLGNVYVTGTTTSTTLKGTSGAAIPNRTDSSTNSFVAKFDTNLNPIFVTFTGGNRIAATSIAATGDSVFVTGSLFSATLPVTTNGVQQAPAYDSSQNGFVERFSSDGSTLLYATYLTGAAGNTAPTGIAADTYDDAYIVGGTSSPGYPTIAAVVPAVLGSTSGFLTKLAPLGNSITFSTYIPGTGLSSVALDSTGSNLLLTGSVALGQFPVDTVAIPLVPTAYLALVRMPIDGSTVLSSTLLAPGAASYVASNSAGAIWVDGTLAEPLLPIMPFADFGQSFAIRIDTANRIDQTARFGGLPNGETTYASVPLSLTSLAVDPAGEPILAGGIEPGASSSLLATETYDVPLYNDPTTALPSSIGDAELSASVCNGSLCAGSAAYLAKLNSTVGAPSLSFSPNSLPFVVLRNLGSVAATGLQLTANGPSISTDCPLTLYTGAECTALIGGAAGTLTASASNAASQTIDVPATTAPASTIVFAPKELDFGIRTSTSAPATQVITVSNLGQQSQTFLSRLDVTTTSKSSIASPYSQLSTDCAPTSVKNTYLLAAGGTCHITVAFTAPSLTGGDAFEPADWAIGTQDVFLTGYQQAASLSVSATEEDFGTQFQNGLRLPRYVYLSNSSTAAVAHAAVTLPAGSPFTVTDQCPALLAPASVCQLRLDYLSTQFPSSDATTLALDDGLNVLITGQSLPQPGVTGASANPNLAVSPTSVTFANSVAVTAVSGSTQTVTIANQGSSAFALTIALTGDFTDTTNCGPTLAGGASCSVILSFAPSQPGTRNGLLAVSAGSATTPTYVPISATARAILPANNGILNQGSVSIGQPSFQWYKVSQPLSMLSAATTGPYTVVTVEDIGYGHGQPPTTAFTAATTGTCFNCWLGIEFLPTVTGVQTGTLTLTSSPAGNPYVLTLTGIGLPLSGLLLTPLAADFGIVPVDSTSGPMLFTLTNLSTTASAITVAPPATTGPFAVTAAPSGGPACGGTLAYGSACFIQVAMAPVATGAQTGSLTLTAPGLSVTANLTGTAPADPGIALNPTALTFNNVPGTTSVQQTVQLKNTTQTTEQVSTPTVATASFALSSSCASLAPAATCTITVTFTPGPATVTDILQIPVTQTPGGSDPVTATFPVPLAGAYTSVDAGLEIVPTQTEFGPAAVATTAITRQFTIDNLTAKTVALSVDIPQDFALIGPACTNLAPNGSCTFSATFAPLTNGDIPGSLVATGTPTDGSANLQGIAYVEGYGLGTATLTITGNILPGSLVNFGQVASGQTGTQTLTLTNTGNAPLNIRRIVTEPPFLASSTCTAPLAPAGSCSVTLTYSPVNQVVTGTSSPANTSDSGTLLLVSDAGSSPVVLDLAGQGGPVLVSSPANATPLVAYTLSTGSLTFALTTVGDVSASQTVTLTNTGNATIQILSIATTTDFTVQNGCATVVPGATCSLSVTATPQSAGQHIAALEIASSASASLDFVSLLVSGESSSLSVSPTSLAFGAQLVATTSAPQTVQVANTGTAPIVFAGITVTGQFGATSTCPGVGGTLAAGATCTIAVTFQPTATGAQTGSVQIASSASTLPLIVTLTGTGVVPQLSANPAALTFPGTTLGSSSSASLALTNNGTTPITGIVLTVMGDFAVTVPCTPTLAPGATCTVQLGFSPAQLGPRTGTLTITSSDPGSPAAVALSGIGLSPAGFALTVDGAASATVTVRSGIPASYALTLTPQYGYSGTVALTCTPVIVAEYATCSLLPPSLILAGGSQSATATINTLTSISAANDAPLSFTRTQIASALLLPGMVLVLRIRRRLRGRFGVLLSVLALATFTLLTGCGGSSPSNLRYTPAGTYQFQVSANATNGIPMTQTVTLNLIVD
jgi:hypothetical protein